MLSKRSHEPEWMDLGNNYYSESQYRDCLFQLGRIGRFLGGDKATLSTLRHLSNSPRSILDVGCGGGIFTLRLAKNYPQTTIIGIDLSQEAIAFAQERLNEELPSLNHVQFLATHSNEIEKNQKFDVIIATLVCHHLLDEELVDFLKQGCQMAEQAIILNDLHRHPLATIGFAVVTPVLFPNRMIWHDGLLSIRRGFTRQEWKNLLEAADIDEQYYTISWHWPFRWIVKIDTQKMRAQ